MPMLTAAYTISLALVVLAVWRLRGMGEICAARWCLWLGLLLALVAMTAGRVPSNAVTLSSIICFFIYVVIQDMRFQAVLADLKAE
jgi:hypothetical protein